MKNSRHGLNNPNARYRKENSVEDVLASPVVSDPLRLLDIATSDGAAALVVASKAFTEKHLGSTAGCRRCGRCPVRRPLPAAPARTTRHRHRLPPPSFPHPERVFKDHILDVAYAEAGIGPQDLSLAEVYDLSTALELDWYEHLGLCPKGEAEQLLRSGATTVGGRIPVNPSGGLACFGRPSRPRPSPSLRTHLAAARSGHRPNQVEGATVGVTANQGCSATARR